MNHLLLVHYSPWTVPSAIYITSAPFFLRRVMVTIYRYSSSIRLTILLAGMPSKVEIDTYQFRRAHGKRHVSCRVYLIQSLFDFPLVCSFFLTLPC